MKDSNFSLKLSMSLERKVIILALCFTDSKSISTSEL